MLLQPGNILVTGAGINNHAEVLLIEEIHDQVIDHATGFIQHAAVECLAAVLEAIDVVRQQVAQEVTYPCTGQVHHGHMGDIEHTGILAYRVMFIDLGAVIYGHVPAGKVDQFAAGGNMFTI